MGGISSTGVVVRSRVEVLELCPVKKEGWTGRKQALPKSCSYKFAENREVKKGYTAEKGKPKAVQKAAARAPSAFAAIIAEAEEKKASSRAEKGQKEKSRRCLTVPHLLTSL